MPINRFYAPESLVEGEQITCGGDEARHMLRVLRVQKGDHVEFFSGDGVLARGVITSVQKQVVEVVIETSTRHQRPDHEVHLWQAYVRPNKLDLIVEKGTELGVTHFHFFPASRSEKAGITPSQQHRLLSIATAGCKQSGRLFLPTLNVEASLQSLNHGWYGDVTLGARHLLEAPHEKVVQFVNGPEAGLTEQEIVELHKQGLSGVSLSNAVLRTETAAVLAAGYMHYAVTMQK